MTVKETYHADCLRIKQLEKQLVRYQEIVEIMENAVEVFIPKDIRKRIAKLKESEQNGKGT